LRFGLFARNRRVCSRCTGSCETDRKCGNGDPDVTDAKLQKCLR